MRSIGPACSIILLVACGGGVPETPICSAEELASAADAAGDGDVIRIGDCSVDASVRIASGVTLQGTTIRSAVVASGDFAVIAEAGATVRQLRIESDAVVALGATGAGAIVFEDLEVDVTRGYGILARGPGLDLSLTRVAVSGVVTVGNADSEDFVTPSGEARTYLETATHGVVIAEASVATLESVDVSGFTDMGVVFDRVTAATWTTGSVSEILGTALVSDESNTTLDGVAVRDTLQGLRIQPSFSLVAVDRDGARDQMLQTTNLLVERGAGYGVVQVGTSASHAGLSVSSQRDVGLWVGDSPRFEISGAASTIRGNGFAGVMLNSVDDAQMQNVLVEDTQLRVNTDMGRVEVGDGVHVNDTPLLSMDTVQLFGNARGGLLVNLGSGGTSGLSFASVDVERRTGMVGALAGSSSGAAVTPDAATGWDTGITRDADTTSADTTFSGTLPVLDGVSPAGVPDPVEIAAGMGLPL